MMELWLWSIHWSGHKTAKLWWVVPGPLLTKNS